MDLLSKNNFELKFNFKKQDVFENDIYSHSLFINEEYEILFIVQTNNNYNKDDYFSSKIFELSNGLHQEFGYENCFYILNSKNHFYLIPFFVDCPQSNKLNDFKIIEEVFNKAKKNTILRRINNEYNKINIEIRDLLHKTNDITKHFYNYWLKYGDLKKFNYCDRIQIELPRYIYEELDFSINILEPEEIARPDIESDVYKYLQTSFYFNEYIKNRDEITEVFKNFCKKNNLNFKIKNEKYFCD